MTDAAHIAQADQVQAAFRTWAECVLAAQRELMRVGVPQETALDMAREWVLLMLQRADDA
jgi:hypothetical protein